MKIPAFVQTHAIALGFGIIIGAAFKGLITIGLILMVAGGSVYGYRKMTKTTG